MSILQSNGINLQVSRFLRGTERTPIYDGPQYLYTRWRIICRALYNPQATSYVFPFQADAGGQPVATPTVAAQTDISIRHRLMVPRKQLILGVGNVAWLVSPQQGFTVDSANGPTPLFCNVVKGPGGHSFVVDFGIETCLRECNLENSTYPSILLSHRWEMSQSMDEDFFTTRTIKGHAIFDTARIIQGQVIPDQFRGALFHPIPPRCQRRIPIIRQSEDGTSVDYVIQDEEQAISLDKGCVDANVTRIEANMNVSTAAIGAGGIIGEAAHIAIGAGERAVNIGAANRAFTKGGAGAARGVGWLAAAGAVLDVVGELLPLTTRVIVVDVWGNGKSNKRELLLVAQRVADALAFRVNVPFATTKSWQAGVQLDFKGRHVQVQAQIIHTPIVDSIQALFQDTIFWPEIDARDDVNLNGVQYLTANKGSTNAVPPGDTKSRGTFLELLTAQGLSDPCSPQYAPISPDTAAPNDIGNGPFVGLTPVGLDPGPKVNPITQFTALPQTV